MANNTIKRTWNQGSMVTIEDLLGMTFQAESGGHTFVISGVDADGNAVALSGTPSGVMLRPDDTDQALTCSVSGGKVYATLPAGCYDVPGRAGITIFLTNNGQKVAIYAAVVSISRTQSGTVAPGTTASVVDLINAINAAIAGIPATDTALKAAMAPTYSTSGLYAVGSYSWYNGTLYRCTTPITSGETWNSAHWVAAALGNDVSDLKSALISTRTAMGIGFDSLFGDYTKTNETDETAQETISGGYINSSGGVSTGLGEAWSVKRYSVNAGQLYRLHGNGVALAGSFPLAVFYRTIQYDPERVILANATANAQNYNIEYTPTENGYVYIALYANHGELKINKVTKTSEAYNRIGELEKKEKVVDKNLGMLYGDYSIENIELEEVSETLEGYYISNAGWILGGIGSDFVVKRFDVEAGRPYRVYGNGVSLADSFPLAVMRDTLTLTTPAVAIIANATATAQNFNVVYTPQVDGYIYIASVSGHGEATLYRCKKTSETEQKVDELDGRVDKIEYSLGEAPVKATGEATRAARDVTYYINESLGISSLGESATTFWVDEYAVSNGKKYVIYGERVSLAGSYPLAMFRTTGGTSVMPAGTLIASATTAAQNYYEEYTATQDGYIYIAAVSGRGQAILLDAEQLTKVNYDIKALNGGISDKVIYCLGDSIVYLGGSWAFQLGEQVMAQNVYNVGRGGATWADRGASFIEYNEDCEIWNKPLRATVQPDGITEAYSANLDLASCEPPIDSNYATISNEIRFMNRLINDFDRKEPDLIIIACGVNDSRNSTPIYSDSSFNAIFETDLDDMTLSQRSTIGGGLRWCIETLMTEYPDAAIVIATPIQTAYNGIAPYVKNTCDWIRAFANRYSLPLIDAYNESGICNIFETSGSSGRYLYDGLHPNSKGQLVMGKYFCHQIIQKYNAKSHLFR